ncbi:MAG: metallophosphoesterase [Spirochaetales bacterium]|nr:metallophosphoesterase [Spirochaetales bacterium]
MKRRLAFPALILALVLALICSCATQSSGDTAFPKNVTVSLGISTVTMRAGEQRTFTPTFKNTDTPPKLIWTSSDESILTVDQDGTVTAHNTTDESLTATITASIADKPSMRSVCTITVLSPTQPHFVTTGPGQDASTQAVISWHSPDPVSTIQYTDAGKADFSNSITLDGEPTLSEWADLTYIYRYRVVLDCLKPDSTYRYRIALSDGTYSETSTFRTAGTDGTFSFAWLSDVHAATKDSMGNISRILDYEKEKTDISFCLFTGDLVNQGKRYSYWQSWNDSGLLSEMTFAFVIGNHEYYPNKTADKATPSFYLDFVAIPDNSGKSAPADYWFLYDNVLFICLDTMAGEFAQSASGNEALEKQAKWFADVVGQNEGKYTYLIVAQHYAFLDGDVEGTGFYSFWYPIFDRYGVDLALASDTHIYSRSKTLFDNKVSSKGTVYITSPISEGKELDEILNRPDALGERSAFNAVEKKLMGGSYLEVTPQNLTVHVIGKDGIEFDSVTIPAK